MNAKTTAPAAQAFNLTEYYAYYLGTFAAKVAKSRAATRVDFIDHGANAELVEAAAELNAKGHNVWVVRDHGDLFAHVYPEGAEVAPTVRYCHMEILARP